MAAGVFARAFALLLSKMAASERRREKKFLMSSADQFCDSSSESLLTRLKSEPLSELVFELMPGLSMLSRSEVLALEVRKTVGLLKPTSLLS
jgi:hypothetical protein